MINHRGPEFAAILRRVVEQLRYFFQTEHEILTFPSAGTGAMEASIVNLFSPGEQVAAVTIGVFGDRFANIAEIFSLQVQRIAFPWGRAADPDEVVDRLANAPDVKGVLLTHNETSTGVTNDMAALAQAIRRRYPDVLIVVDAVSSLSCIDLPIDRLDLDVVFTGSQKGWMVPPGLAMVRVGPRAWAANARAKLPRMYWDFAATRRSMEKGQTPYTPPVSLFYGLDVALELMRTEGREAIFARHAQLGAMTRAHVQGMGLDLFADPAHASNTVTAVRVPEGLDVKALLKVLREEDGVVLAGGQQRLDGQIFRIGHLGFVHEPDLTTALDALERRVRSQVAVSNRQSAID
jgi:aspartate aminotransferase-like enzyme